ncbi:MAG: 50S ribosomal protein L11 methyltransferase [Syntrophaceae bacterium]
MSEKSTKSSAGPGIGKDAWVEIKIQSPPDLVDAISNFLIELGTEGISQEEDVSQKDFEESAPAKIPDVLKAYFPERSKWEQKLSRLSDYLDSLKQIFPEFEKPEFAVRHIADQDWGEQWKKYFKPVRIFKNIVIKPTWERYTASGRDIVIEIDPGMAFGTGQHPSTRMCLESIEEILMKERMTRKWNVLDIGTGTGILSIGAAKLGADRVVAVDIDPKAAEIAQQNVNINHVDDRVSVMNLDIINLDGSFDMIVANLTAETISKLSGHIEPMLAPSGYLVCSGIIEQRAKMVEEALASKNLIQQKVLTEKEWVCYIYKKRDK